MKNQIIRLSTFFLLFVMALTIGCNKDTSSPIESSTETLSVKVDGIIFSPDILFAEMGEIDGIDPQSPIKKLEVVAGLDGRKLVTFTIFSENNPVKGTYKGMGNCMSLYNCASFMMYVNSSVNQEATFISGTNNNAISDVTFLTLDYRIGGRVKGTFSGVMFDDDTGEKTEFTDGVFDVLIE